MCGGHQNQVCSILGSTLEPADSLGARLSLNRSSGSELVHVTYLEEKLE